MKAVHYVILGLAALISCSHGLALIFPHYAVQILGAPLALMPVLTSLALVSGSASDRQLVQAVARSVATTTAPAVAIATATAPTDKSEPAATPAPASTSAGPS